jgi:hypothetical protein
LVRFSNQCHIYNISCLPHASYITHHLSNHLDLINLTPDEQYKL